MMNRVAGSAAPLSASSHEGRLLRLRLSGSAGAVRAAAATLGGDIEPDAQAVAYWKALREQSLPFFGAAGNLWRLSLPATAPPLGIDGAQLLEWGGALRWLRSECEPDAVRAAAAAAGGHATLYRGDIADNAVFPPLAPPVEALHRRLKSAFDPARVLNPGRMYSWL
jgi:glycolate oxidase FAD binding subunit